MATTTQLNTPGMRLAAHPGVHAMTDVTGFGLLGHLLEVCRGSRAGATIAWEAVPLLSDALALAHAGHVTGGSSRNWQSYGASVDLAAHGPLPQALLTDPQTSGGLLVACSPAAVEEVLEVFRAEGFDRAAAIGEVTEGEPRVTVV
jgi:selenide,water dikinase